MGLNFSNCSNFNVLRWFLINLIDDDACVSGATAVVCSMVHRVCLFMKTHLVAFLQGTSLDKLIWLIVFFLRKLSACVRNITAFCQDLPRPIKSAVLADTGISMKPRYRPDISAKPIYGSGSISKITFCCWVYLWKKTIFWSVGNDSLDPRDVAFMNARHASMPYFQWTKLQI